MAETDVPDPGAPATELVRLWDRPVRLIHWSFVLLLPAMWWTGEEGELDWHRRLGALMLALILFRIGWGFAGGTTARFASFVKGPAALFAYLRSGFGGASPTIGHNPAGGWSVVLMLLLLAGQVATGLIAQDVDGLESGPLSHLVSYELSDAARGWHHFLFDMLLILICVHIAAILFHAVVKRDDLVGPMLSGRKRLPPGTDRPAFAAPWKAALLGIVSAAISWWVISGAPLP